MKILRCYCNDEILCPVKKYLKQKLEITNTNNSQDDIIRHCSTNTVCLTKRLRRLNGTTWLKYFCDQSSSESIRGKVIEYRDCKINSTNKHDKQQAEKSSEYCCDSHDYCNKYLNPINSVRDIEEFTLLTSNDININTNNNNNNQLNNGLTLFTTINLVLLSSLLVFLILTIILILLYFIKNNKIIIKSKLNLNNNNSKKLISNLSSSISTATSNSTTATSLNSKENSYNSSSLYPNNNGLSFGTSKQLRFLSVLLFFSLS